MHDLGLVAAEVWTPPACVIGTCADPPEGNGYAKPENVWESLGAV